MATENGTSQTSWTLIMSAFNVLVTGASGFTGSWLTRQLLRGGARVITLLSHADPESMFVTDGLIDAVTCEPGTILEYDRLLQLFDKHRIDSVFHLAAISVEGKAHQDPRSCFEVNIRGTYNVLECCRVRSGMVERVVVASSDKVYGDSPHLPYTEDLPVQGMYAYDVSKSCVDLIARSYFCSFGLPVTVARFANIYGGGDLNFSRLVPNTIRRLMGNEPPLIRSPDGGTYKRDFLYVEDQVRAYLALWERMDRADVLGRAFNFGMGTCIPVPEVVGMIRRIMKREEIQPIWQRSDHGEIVQQQLSSERAKETLKWEPICPLEEGLAETVDWYARNLRRSA